MELKWWWYHQLETAQIFISLWQVGREMPQVKQTVSQMSLQIREGSSGDLLLEARGAAAERHHPERREQLWAARPVWAPRLDPGARSSQASLLGSCVHTCTLLSTEQKKCGYMNIRTSWPGALSGVWSSVSSLCRSPEHFDLSLFCRWMITGSSLHLPLLWFLHL